MTRVGYGVNVRVLFVLRYLKLLSSKMRSSLSLTAHFFQKVTGMFCFFRKTFGNGVVEILKQCCIILSMLLIDRREPFLLQELLAKVVPTKVVQLPRGDYICGRCIIERKTVSDLFSSLNDQRFWHQIHTLLVGYEKAFLLVEGSVCLELQQKFQGLCNYTCMRYGVGVIYTKNVRESAALLKKFYRFQKTIIPSLILPRIKCHSIPQYAILCQFPRIGLKTARELMNTFGTLEQVFQASSCELKTVLGGKRRSVFRHVLKNPVGKKLN